MSRALLEVHSYTASQTDTLFALTVICSTLSFLGSLFIIFNYCAFREFKQNFAFKLIFCVAIGDFLSSVGNFLGNPDNETVCIVQGMFAELGALTSICWVTAISLSIWLVISRETPPTNEDTAQWLKKMHMVVWSYIIVCVLLPFTTSSYGPAGGWCWIKGKTTADNAWRFTLFYIPLWLCVAFMSFVYCRVWTRLNATAQDTKRSEAFLDHDNEDSFSGNGHTAMDEEERRVSRDNSSRSSTLQRMKYYPMVLIVCYAPATVRRMTELFSGDDHISPWGLAAVQIVCAGLIGFVNAIVYAFSQKAVRDRDARWCRETCCGDKTAKVDFPMEIPPQDVDLGDSIKDRI